MDARYKELLGALQKLAQEMANTWSHYEGEFGDGYDMAKHGAAYDLQELIEIYSTQPTEED
ncbi:hypothetical protein HC928_18020 [bacterium]|nr:hypothetical protein [bacterium]